MKRVVKANSVSNNLDARLDSNLQDFAQVTGKIDYNDIIEFGKLANSQDVSDLKKCFRNLNSICREMGVDYYEASEQDQEAFDIVNDIVQIVKMNSISRKSSRQIKGSDMSPSANRAATQVLIALRNLYKVMSTYEDNIEQILDDPSYYEATQDQIRYLESFM